MTWTLPVACTPAASVSGPRSMPFLRAIAFPPGGSLPGGASPARPVLASPPGAMVAA